MSGWTRPDRYYWISPDQNYTIAVHWRDGSPWRYMVWKRGGLKEREIVGVFDSLDEAKEATQ